MFELKPLSRNAVPAALAKAERYRLLNEPMQAASICEDILRVEPDNAAARVALILALSDEFGGPEQVAALTRARTLLPGLPSEYERAYYTGICVKEPVTSAVLTCGPPGSASVRVAFASSR